MTGFAAIAIAVWHLSAAPMSRADVQRTEPDSTRLVRSARSAQSSFESFRRAHLPVSSRSNGPCDVHIGQYCYWREDRNQPEEPPEIVQRRNELLRVLDSVSSALPGDPWVAGQRIRYLVEAGRTNEALQFAGNGCHVSADWCAALAGYAAHVAGRFETADSAYAVALAAMTPEDRCNWLDISLIVDDATADRLHSLDCAKRGELTRWILRLASPLYSVSSTDLYTEQLTRVIRAKIDERAATADGVPWGEDQRTLTLRYGFPRWYTRSLPSSASMQASVSVTGHDGGQPYDFLPPGDAVDHIAHIAATDWSLDDPRAVTGYAPSYARSVHDMPNQIAIFRRGDSALVVGAWDARQDTTLLGRDLVAAIAFARDTGFAVVARDSRATATGRLTGIGAIDSGLVSLELLATSDKRAARVRTGLPPRSAGRIGLSSLLLYAPSSEPAYDIAAVKDSALASAIIPLSRSVGVYWETYGANAGGEPVHFTLTVEQIGVSWARRVAERLHLADPTSALRLQWDEVARPDRGVAGRGVRVDLSRLRGGRYVVTLDVATRENERASSAKEIVIR